MRRTREEGPMKMQETARVPLYLTVSDAAAYAGIGRDLLLRYMDSDDPPPYLKVGNRRMLQVSRLGDYLERKQDVIWK
jgi:hypothetical protein